MHALGLQVTGKKNKPKQTKKKVGILYQSLLGKPDNNIDTNIRVVAGQDLTLR